MSSYMHRIYNVMQVSCKGLVSARLKARRKRGLVQYNKHDAQLALVSLLYPSLGKNLDFVHVGNL